MKAAKTVFKGIKGLVASGPGTKKTAAVTNMPRPEGVVRMDKNAGAKKMGAMPMRVNGAPKNPIGTDPKGVKVGIRPEPPVKRDAMDVAKPFGSKK